MPRSQCYECCSKQTRQSAKPNPSFVTMKKRQDSAGLALDFDETIPFSHPFEDGVQMEALCSTPNVPNSTCQNCDKKHVDHGC